MISNLPFVLVGIYGIWWARAAKSKFSERFHYRAALIFFVGMMLTGFGSAYYHLSPDNQTLVWDRLPMTIAFMAFFCFVLSLHISVETARKMLWPLIYLGISSVFYWAYTESIGEGDLRFYGVIQFLPMVLIPVMVLMFPNKEYSSSYIWQIVSVYMLAKFAEHFDYQLYEMIAVSGHVLKHVIAAVSGVIFVLVLKSMRHQGV